MATSRLSPEPSESQRRDASTGHPPPHDRCCLAFDDRDLKTFYGVASRDELRALDIGPDDIAAQIAARRWQRAGLAIVLHNGVPDTEQRRRISILNSGPRAVFTSFTAAEKLGLRGWERPEIHVLAPAGTRRPAISGLILHRTANWDRVDKSEGRRLHVLPQALIVAASSFSTSRPACGLLAAAVQQRLTNATALAAAVIAASRSRHRAALLRAVEDIGQGAQALSEIDFVQLCRRFKLPPPTLQAVRVEPDGRRRYLDAQWQLPDGRVRFPSVVVRDSPFLVADQLARLLLPA